MTHVFSNTPTAEQEQSTKYTPLTERQTQGVQDFLTDHKDQNLTVSIVKVKGMVFAGIHKDGRVPTDRESHDLVPKLTEKTGGEAYSGNLVKIY